MATYKTEIFEELFNKRWDGERLSKEFVTLEQIRSAIDDYNKRTGEQISMRNPANFFKDFVRNIDLANANWPDRLKNLGYTAIQSTGGGNAFRFVPMKAGAAPFPKIEKRIVQENPVIVQSLSMTHVARHLGRRDDAWLMQVAVELRLIETHIASSPISHDITHIQVLQLGVKQARAEINGLFLAEHEDGSASLITVETKVRDDIYLAQVLAQVDAARSLRMNGLELRGVIPIAVKAEGNSIIRVVQFAALAFTEGTYDTRAEFQALYKIMPEVSGL